MALRMGALLIAAFAACIMSGCAPEVTSTMPPPADKNELIGTAPGADYSWTKGYWWPQGSEYVWHPGKWEQNPNEALVYQRERYEERNGIYYFYEGGWQYRIR